MASDHSDTSTLPDLPRNDSLSKQPNNDDEEPVIIPTKRKVNPGLVDEQGERFPLKALHVRAKLVDLAGEVQPRV